MELTFFQHHKRALIIAAILVVIGGVIFFKTRSTKTAVQYQTASAQTGTLVVSLTGSGQVSSNNASPVNTQASGVVTKLFVKEGQHVKAGDAIAQLSFDLEGKQNADAAFASYQNAKNTLASAQAQLYSLQSTLFATNQKFINGAVAQNLASTDPTYIQQDADWLAAQAQYERQQQVISQAQTALTSAYLSYQQASNTIYAPIEGTVSGLSIQIGSVITQNRNSNTTSATTETSVANILTGANPTISLNLTEIDVPKVMVGDKATITFDALPNETFTGKVASIDTVGIISSGVTTYPTIIQLDTPSNQILPNMNATATIIEQAKNDVLMVPLAAVQTNTNGQSTVQIMQASGTPKTVAVQTGLSSDTQVEITSGLSDGDIVVTGTTTPNGGAPRATTSLFGGTLGGGGARILTGGGGGFGGGGARGGAAAGR